MPRVSVISILGLLRQLLFCAMTGFPSVVYIPCVIYRLLHSVRFTWCAQSAYQRVRQATEPEPERPVRDEPEPVTTDRNRDGPEPVIPEKIVYSRPGPDRKPGNSNWVHAVEWSGQKGFEAAPSVSFTVDGEEKGVQKKYGPLMFLKVHDAGHMVPMDQPNEALEMLQRWSHGNL
ncbi:hypothetical protein H5410_002297 [Solanum commersonii]|uniref:Uncharacterized protein n=1 Tax=Solanum commersonii TaxID=4109 RepID=A0A9J6B1Q0_SOLCO|nr:hypothetical protein H5410_002297 [Solanum commersonii]